MHVWNCMLKSRHSHPSFLIPCMRPPSLSHLSASLTCTQRHSSKAFLILQRGKKKSRIKKGKFFWSFPGMGSNLLFIVLLFLGFSCLRRVCGNAELIALMEIKAALDPENKHLSSWTSDGDPCGGSFEGVACNELNKVGNISLQSRGLAGKLPPAVAQLKCLSGLYLHYNNLNGEIPREIANLTELTDLYLNVNNFSGNIPPEIGSMPSLKGVCSYGLIFAIRFIEFLHSLKKYKFWSICCFCFWGPIE